MDRREQIAEILDDFAYDELNFERQQKLIDAILALDAVTQDECPLRYGSESGIHYCDTGGSVCDDYRHKNCHGPKLIQSWHASRCRECQKQSMDIVGKLNFL